MGGREYSGPTQILCPSITDPKFFNITNVHLGEGDTPDKLKSNVPQSHKFAFWEGGYFWVNSNPKSLNLTNFHFRGGGGGGSFWNQLYSKVPESDNFSLEGYSGPTQTQSSLI